MSTTIFNLSLRNDKDSELIDFLDSLPKSMRSYWVRKACYAWLKRKNPRATVVEPEAPELEVVIDDPFFNEFGR